MPVAVAWVVDLVVLIIGVVIVGRQVVVLVVRVLTARVLVPVAHAHVGIVISCIGIVSDISVVTYIGHRGHLVGLGFVGVHVRVEWGRIAVQIGVLAHVDK